MLTGATLPYGLRDVKLIPIDANGNEGAAVDLPVSQKFSFSETEEYEELRGDDKVVAIVGKGPTSDWSLEAGGISLEAWHVLTGGTLTDLGTTPNQSKEFLKKVTDRRPYFKVIGQSIGDGGGDTWCELYKCKCDGNLEGEFSDGTFFITSCSGTALGDLDDNLYKITWHETPVAIPTAGINEMQTLYIDATGGTFDLTYSGQTAAGVAGDGTLTASALRLALEGLSNLAPGDVIVTGPTGGPFTIEFAGTLAATDVAKLTTDSTDLTGGAQTAFIYVLRAGAAA